MSIRIQHLPILCVLAVAAFACTATVQAALLDPQRRTTSYNYGDNDPMFSDEIAGQPGSGTTSGTNRANLSLDGSFASPTTLAVGQDWFDGGGPSGYYKEGDLAYITELGWFRVEDTCANCLNADLLSVDVWAASATQDEINALDNMRLRDVFVFHPSDTIRQDLLGAKADPAFWQTALWTDAAHRIADSNLGQPARLFVDGQLQAPLSVPAPTPLLLFGAGLAALALTRRARPARFASLRRDREHPSRIC
jgi:hypothetical protein